MTQLNTFPSTPSSVLNKRHTVITLMVCFLVAVIEGIDVQAAGIAGIGVGEHFSLSKAQLGLFFSSGVLGLLPGGLLGGYFADKIGRRWILTIAVGVFGLFTLLTSFVDSYYGLLMVRFFSGAGIGAAVPNLIALAAESVDNKSRGRAVGIMYTGMPLGAALLSYIASFSFGNEWKNIFYLGGILPIIIIPVMLWLLPESKAFIDVRNQYYLNKNQENNNFKLLFSNENRILTIFLGMGFFLTLIVVYIMLSWLPTLFKELGFSRQQGSTAQFLFMLSASIGAFILSILLDKWNKRNVVILMYAGIMIGLFGLNIAKDINQMYLASCITGMFVIGSQGTLYGISGIVYPTELRATGAGTVASIGRIGAIIGPLLAAEILTMGFGASGVIITCIPCLIIAGICMFITLRKHYSS